MAEQSQQLRPPSTTTKSPRKRKKYQFTYFHYDPPPYWYVWPEIPKCTKRECLLASKKKIIPKVGSNFKTGTDSREMLSSTSKSISKVAAVPHSRQITPDLLKEPTVQTAESAEKTAATATRQETTAKAMHTVQPFTSTESVAATADVNVPSSAQTSQSQVHHPEQRPAKKLSRFTVTPVQTPLPSAVTTVSTAATPQNVGLAKAGTALTAGTCSTSTVTPARIQQAPLSIPFPASKLLTVDSATKPDPSQQESTLKFMVTPVTGQAQKFRVTPMPEKKTSAQHAAVPASYIVTTGLMEPLQSVQATPPTQAALQVPSQPLPQTQQQVQSFAQQAVNVAEAVHRPTPTTIAAHNQATQPNVMRPTRVTRAAAARQPLPVLVEEPELEELEDVTQAETTSTSTSQISTISNTSSDVSTAGSTSTWKTIIRRPQEPTLYFVVEPCGRSHQTTSVTIGSSTAETTEQRIQSPTGVVRCGVPSGHKVIAFAELYMRVISECNQTEAIFERLNVRLCDLERAHEELRTRTANRPVQYNQSQ
uniref:ULP_PROTEASE domain-containing protein n=1 Tax=Ascaris lumbricoides TaxID=6252 RepID=A0A0M3HU59_ASCLU